MIRRKIISFIIFLIALTFYVNVEAESVNLQYDTVIYYGSGAFTRNYYTTNRTSQVTNGYCLEPPKYPPSRGTHNSVEITNNATYKKLVKSMYYSKYAPGWSSANMAQHYLNALGVAKSNNNMQYAYSHVINSYYYNTYVTHTSGWAWRVPIAGNITNPHVCSYAGDIICLIDGLPDPPSSFHVYLIDNNLQDIVYWKSIPVEEYGAISVTKKIQGAVSNQDKDPKNYTFALYTDSNCNQPSSYGEVTTNANGVATWSKVKLGTYYINETNMLNSQRWENVSHCVKVTLSKNSPKVNNVYTVSTNYTNRMIWYATKVYKEATIQNENGTTKCTGYVNGAKFKLWQNGVQVADTAEATTGGAASVVHANTNGDNRISMYDGVNCNTTDGTAVFTMIDYPTGFKVKETSSDTYTATVNCNGTRSSFVLSNNNKNALLPANSDLKVWKMTYNESTGKYFCPTNFKGDDVLNNKKSNTPVYYCLKVKKTDKDTGEVITKQATFTATKGNKSYTANYQNAAGENISVEWDNTMQYFTRNKIPPEGVTVMAGKTGTTTKAQSCLVLLSENTEGEEFISIILSPCAN